MNLNPLSDPNRSVLLSPPEYDVTSRDGAVVEHEWDIVAGARTELRNFAVSLEQTPVPGYAGLIRSVERRLESSLQTIRELTEVKQ